MKPLEPPDSLHLEAAKGWCGLHSFLDANDELEKISPSLRAHPLVLEIRWQVYSNLEKWEGALEIASALVKMRPDWPNGWIYQAIVFNEMHRNLEAHETLIMAVSRFPKDEIILYDLACICCALKRIDEARTWLGKAIEVGGKKIKLKALDDPDLELIWKNIRA